MGMLCVIPGNVTVVAAQAKDRWRKFLIRTVRRATSAAQELEYRQRVDARDTHS
jgi:hypothetical protein